MRENEIDLRISILMEGGVKVEKVSKDNYDFAGWVTKNNLKCADGLTIRQDAFSTQDGTIVPLVYNHNHDEITNVLGHTLLENRPEGVYGYSKFNDTPHGQHARAAVNNGDLTSMSIWADNLSKSGRDVMHGVIREVSLVLAGANPGAMIESTLMHGISIGDEEDEAIIYTGDDFVIVHSNIEKKGENEVADEDKKEDGKKTVKDVFDTLNEEQKKAVAIIVGQAIQDAKKGGDDNDKKEDDEVKHNVFSNSGAGGQGEYLSHSQEAEIFKRAKECRSFKQALHEFCSDNDVIIHSIDTTGMTTATGKSTYGFNDPDMLFPEYKSLNMPPEWISRNMDWVSKVIGGVHRTPYSRIKSMYADITEDEARAKGYITGKQKKDEVFTTLKRTTDPQTVYKRQKMDRDTILDITDFDVVAWIRGEMRVMLNEEIARAILIGDGRPSDSDDKIQENHIRPIVTDVPLFNVVVKVSVGASATPSEIADATIDAIIRSRKKYKGSGNPTFWTSSDPVTEMLLLKDGIGHKLYKTETELATTLRVKDIVEVEPMENHKITYQGKSYPLIGTICNLTDYNVGTDKGGQIENFEDFDIDYNQYKYLIETRMSGALIKPFSAITLILDVAAATSNDTDDGDAAG